MGKLSTHILDLAHGKPGAGISIEFYQVNGSERKLVKQVLSNQDGRTNEPLLEGEALVPGCYELVFLAGDYFAALGVEMSNPRFIDRVTLAFGVADASQNYHVPLLVSPWAYSTYRGS